MTAPGINLQLLLSTLAAQRQLQQDMTNAARRAGSQASNAFDAAFRPRNIAQDLLPFAATAVVSRGFQTIIKSAQQYEAAVSATSQVYGELAGSLNNFVQANSRGLGIAKKDTQDYLNQFGAILIGLKIGQKEAGDFSIQLIKAGAALAAFRNTSVEQAINALQAGFRGEYDSLQRFIPEVSDLTLRNRALALGLAEVRSNVTQQQKALALLDLVQNSVGRSAGQAELEQGNLQTRLAETKAQSIDAATAIGQRLIPALEGSLDVVNAVGPATVLLGAGMLLMGRRMAASAASGTGFVASMRASASSSFALSAALARQQAQFSGLSFTQALAARNAIVANNAIIASSSAVQGSLTGLGATWGRLAGQMAAAAATGTLAARTLGVAAVAARGVGMGLAAGMAALGGPVTIALTAATIGVGYFLNQQAKQREESKRAAAANKSYAESINEVADRSSNAAIKLAATEVVNRGVAAQAARAGISIDLVTKAYAGQAGAVIDLNKAIADRRKVLQTEFDQLVQNNQTGSERARTIQRELAELYNLEKTTQDNNVAMTDAANKAGLYNQALGRTTVNVSGLTDAYLRGQGALEAYQEAQEKVLNFQRDQFEAAVAYEQAIDDLTESIKTNGTTLDIGTEKGRNNVRAIGDVVDETRRMAEADIAATGTISANTQKKIDGLKQQLLNLGFTRAEVEKLIGIYQSVPPEVVTQVKVLGGADAENKLNAIGQAAIKMIAQYNLTPTQAFGLASGRDPRAVFGQPRAYGGPVYGPNRGDRADNALVMATPGEWVIQKPSVKKLEQTYGPDAMEAINAGRLPIDGRFAWGGPVEHKAYPTDWRSWAMVQEYAKKLHAEKEKSLKPLPSDPGGGPGGGSLGGSAGMMRILRAVFPGLPLWSGYRPGDRTLSGNISYHSSDRAVDVPPREDVARWIHGNYGAGTRELITPYQQWNLLRGRPHTYTGAVWNQHNFAGGNAHVHWAYDQGGLVNPGQVMRNYGTQPEAVLNQEDTVRFRALAGGQVAIRLDDYSIAKIAQALQARPAILEVDGRELARTVMDRGLF